MMNIILVINIFLYLLSPIAYISDPLEMHSGSSASASSSCLPSNTVENPDHDGDQECEIVPCHSWMTFEFLAVSVVRQALPLLAIPIYVPPRLLA